MAIDKETGEIIPDAPDTIAEAGVDITALTRWFELQRTLKEIRDEEMELRRVLFGSAFPTPTEGTNKYALDGGWILNGGYKLTRTVDNAALVAMREQFEDNDISIDKLVKYKPDLVTSEYRKLSDAQRILFDQVLTIKPGSPSLEIVFPKRGA